MQLGKLYVSEELQQLIYKKASNGAQRDQAVTSPKQNPQAPTVLAALSFRASIGLCETPAQLDEIGRLIWESFSDGGLTEDEAHDLQFYVQSRRSSKSTNTGAGPLDQVRRRLSRFRPRRHPRSPDRKASRDRRRRLAGSGALPDNLRHHYTEGQRAVLCIISFEVKRHGICDWPIDKIAALAGVCRTTVQTALHEARRLGHLKITERPRRGQKNLTNIVEIVSLEWSAWVKRGPSSARTIGFSFLKTESPTKSIDLRKKRLSSEARSGVGFATPSRADISIRS